MTWNEFKKYVDDRLSDKEKEYTIFFIDTGNYPELTPYDHLEVNVSEKEITITS